jgi:DNA replication protein DnaC
MVDSKSLTMGSIISGRQIRNLKEADMVRSNIPRSFWNCSLSGIQDKNIVVPLTAFHNKIKERMNDGSGLIITGACGVGKSGAAVVIAKEAARWGYSIYFCTHEDLQELRFDDHESAEGISTMTRIRNTDLLILDGFNEDFIDDKRYGPKELNKLVARRVAARKSTILTTRLVANDVKNNKSISDMFSVMKETMMGVVIKGVDLRESLGNSMVKKILGDS